MFIKNKTKNIQTKQKEPKHMNVEFYNYFLNLFQLSFETTKMQYPKLETAHTNKFVFRNFA